MTITVIGESGKRIAPAKTSGVLGIKNKPLIQENRIYANKSCDSNCRMNDVRLSTLKKDGFTSRTPKTIKAITIHKT